MSTLIALSKVYGDGSEHAPMTAKEFADTLATGGGSQDSSRGY